MVLSGIVHREISKKRSEILSQVDAHILSPLRSHVEIAMADADEYDNQLCAYSK